MTSASDKKWRPFNFFFSRVGLRTYQYRCTISWLEKEMSSVYVSVKHKQQLWTEEACNRVASAADNFVCSPDFTGEMGALVLMRNGVCESVTNCCKIRIRIIIFNDQLDPKFFFVYVYFNSLHVSNIQVLIIRRFNCINTKLSGICHSDRLVCRFGRSVQTCIPYGHLRRVTYTRYRIDTIESPDDEHLNARNM